MQIKTLRRVDDVDDQLNFLREFEGDTAIPKGRGKAARGLWADKNTLLWNAIERRPAHRNPTPIALSSVENNQGLVAQASEGTHVILSSWEEQEEAEEEDNNILVD
ncbi:hypothetical protein E1B28_000120 [Marasmius oreades]|uniref:Uncharacterized protein n=1 Tax=Marasmius oreades TaxID=181124 RepID=A0A9P7V0V7_9AGAR|nr:uncharacterized protein E1B28_000120 [Marasmius oreades]KAG7098150.1 hypothetical protein E1B28_000120 [Marasmius oreades]